MTPPRHHDPIRLVSDEQPTTDPSVASPPQSGGGIDAPPVGGEQFERLPTPIPPPPAPEPEELRLPINQDVGDARMEISSHRDRISVVVRDAPINAVLGMIAEQHGLNLVAAEDVAGTISVTLNNVSLESALDAILGVNGYTWTRQNDIIVVSSLSSESLAGASAQGREVRVFNLNFLSAADADAVVQGLLSPVGKSFIIQSDPLDKLRTREQLVVEDLPAYLHRIASYLAQADCPPRQVQIEAHVLQIDLSDDTRHGVDFEALLARIDGARIGLETTGFVNPNESPAFFFGVDGTDLNVLMQAIKNTTNAKTLASPKVLVVNGQEARIQIGAQLGFLVTTTTQTSTLQEVQFLDVGVVLRVTPQISNDGRILMTVKPEVSTGEVNPLTGLPQEETTEIETTVMLTDGKGMVIGGLIQEADVEDQAKLPIAGDLWLVGKLFRRIRTVRSRSEIVIALVPRLVPYTPTYAAQEEDRLLRATSPLLGPHLERIDRRPLEPELPDAMRNPRRFDPERAKDWFRQHGDPYPYPKTHYFPSADGDVHMYGYFPRDPEVLGGHETYFEEWPADVSPPMYSPPTMYSPPAGEPHSPADSFPPPVTPPAPQQ
ncbi:secretin and TonB N-terminal domain-containing protein [Maioricimonas sp. JC845]|uniref:secretin and TonB N-terminal domain-containing protein n=1 Tax=Maioricimonas sp. JC845 TaxID=3232138 RepID=UPI0034575345